MIALVRKHVLFSSSKRNKYFGFIGDKGTTCDDKSALSMTYGIVDMCLNVFEFLIGVLFFLDMKDAIIAAKLYKCTKITIKHINIRSHINTSDRKQYNINRKLSSKKIVRIKVMMALPM